MAYKSLVKTVSGHFEYRKVGLGLLAGFLLSLTYLSPSIYFSLPFPNVNLSLSSSAGGSPTSNGSMIILGDNRNVTDKSKLKCDADSRSKGELCENSDFIKINGSSSVDSNHRNSLEESLANSTAELSLENITVDERTIDEVHQELTNSTTNYVDAPTNFTTVNRPKVHQDLTNSTTNYVEASDSTNFTMSIRVSAIPTTSATELTPAKFTANSDQSDILRNNTAKNSISEKTKDNLSHSDGETTASVLSAANNSNQSVDNGEDMKPKDTKITCDTNPRRRSDRCEMDGDVRIHGKSGSILYTTSSPANQTHTIQPYARRADPAAMASVRHLSVRPSDNPPRCGAHHAVPAVVFSVTGYTGNFFHDFSDVVVPLFQTTFGFSGKVQFLVTNFQLWWINKYIPILKQLTNYDIIDLDNDVTVRCFPRVIVGLDSDNDLMIGVSRSNRSMVEFAGMLRKAYSLPRDNVVRLVKRSKVKPKLLIVARSRTRRFTNVDEIVKMAERVGFEVAVAEAEQHNVSSFAGAANACDVMVGVHGAGLTNFVFMPTNAVLVQVVPWGGLDWIATNYFDKPSRGTGLRYLEYRIREEESTLSELYSREDPVFADPAAIHRRGWPEMRRVFLVQQNVRLDVRRFRPVLVKALRLLRSKK